MTFLSFFVESCCEKNRKVCHSDISHCFYIHSKEQNGGSNSLVALLVFEIFRKIQAFWSEILYI